MAEITFMYCSSDFTNLWLAVVGITPAPGLADNCGDFVPLCTYLLMVSMQELNSDPSSLFNN